MCSSGTGLGQSVVTSAMNNTRRGTKVAALVAVVGLLAGACGGDDDDAGVSSSDDGSSLFEESNDAEDKFADDGSSDDGAGDAAGSEAENDEESRFSGDDGEMAEDDGGGELNDRSAAEAPAAVESGGLFAESDSEEGDEVAPPEPVDNRFQDYGIRDFVDTDDDPLSTFALDVDTGSFTIGRQYLDDGSLPPRESVRVEEYVNAFDYDYDEPRRESLGISIEGGPSPFDDDNHLVRIGIQSERLDEDDRPAAALTFVIDTSGSMDQGGRLELVKEALEELVEELDESDTVAIVEFDDDPSIVLEPTRVDDVDDILRAINRLSPGGSTNVEGGLELGYDLAGDAFDDDKVNRVILLSDGVANVGLTDPDGLAEMIRRDADRGINLLTVGVGMGNFNDVLMEQLADQGDGFYAYVDTEDEAERLFEDDLTATLVTLALDAKVQVEFDEDIVEEYRLIGFENRGVLDSDFRNNDVDAGEIGAGHSVTAIYEVELERGVDLDDTDELGEVRLRWQVPGSDEVIEIDRDIELHDIAERWGSTSESFQLAVVVATFAEVLRDSPFAADIDLDDLEDEVDALADRTGVREIEELADLVATAERLQ